MPAQLVPIFQCGTEEIRDFGVISILAHREFKERRIASIQIAVEKLTDTHRVERIASMFVKRLFVFILSAVAAVPNVLHADDRCGGDQSSLEAISVVSSEAKWPLNSLVYWLKSVRPLDRSLGLTDYWLLNSASREASLNILDRDKAYFVSTLLNIAGHIALAREFETSQRGSDLNRLVSQGYAELRDLVREQSSSPRTFEEVFPDLSFGELLATTECLALCQRESNLDLIEILSAPKFVRCVSFRKGNYVDASA